MKGEAYDYDIRRRHRRESATSPGELSPGLAVFSKVDRIHLIVLSLASSFRTTRSRPMSHFGVHFCQNVGVSGTTNVHTMKIQKGGDHFGQTVPSVWEARVGIAIMGHCAATTTIDSNPFERTFRDNYARGFGTTEDEAILALKLDLKQTADAIWA